MLKEEEPVCTVRGTRFGEGHGRAMKHSTGRRRKDDDDHDDNYDDGDMNKTTITNMHLIIKQSALIVNNSRI
jgi:hypothetical protein